MPLRALLSHSFVSNCVVDSAILIVINNVFFSFVCLFWLALTLYNAGQWPPHASARLIINSHIAAFTYTRRPLYALRQSNVYCACFYAATNVLIMLFQLLAHWLPLGLCIIFAFNRPLEPIFVASMLLTQLQRSVGTIVGMIWFRCHSTKFSEFDFRLVQHVIQLLRT